MSKLSPIHAESASSLIEPGDVPLVRICGQRDQAIAMMAEASSMIARGHELAEQARKVASEAAFGTVFTPRDRRGEGAYQNLFRPFSAQESTDCFRHSVDAGVWLHLLNVTGMRHLMDATALDEFYADLAGDVPPVTEDNVRATIEALGNDSRSIFLRGLARAFINLDKRFRSHDAFQIGARMIFTRVFTDYGGWDHYSKTAAAVMDVERVFSILDGAPPRPGELKQAIDESRGSGFGPKTGCAQSRYFRVRTFQNGNAHVWLERDDLVQRANLLLAEYYGEVLPDGVAVDVEPEVGTALSKDLAFYATPKPVGDALLRNVDLPDGARVLEPSAGNGNIVRALLALNRSVIVDAVEVHEGRAAHLRQTCPGVAVTVANFLQLRPRPIYELVAMNPPFCGTHWMDHVRQAFEWLAPGGTLLAVLPVSAELGNTKRHQQFRDWASKGLSEWKKSQQFTDLPLESFVESGTRINTVIFVLHKPHV